MLECWSVGVGTRQKSFKPSRANRCICMSLRVRARYACCWFPSGFVDSRSSPCLHNPSLSSLLSSRCLASFLSIVILVSLVPILDIVLGFSSSSLLPLAPKLCYSSCSHCARGPCHVVFLIVVALYIRCGPQAPPNQLLGLGQLDLPQRSGKDRSRAHM